MMTNREKKPTITVKIHKGCEVDIEEVRYTPPTRITIGEAVFDALDQEGVALELFTPDKIIRPGYLMIMDDMEIVSLGIIDRYLEEDKVVKIVPISHGG